MISVIPASQDLKKVMQINIPLEEKSVESKQTEFLQLRYHSLKLGPHGTQVSLLFLALTSDHSPVIQMNSHAWALQLSMSGGLI